jgi:MSHA biogenesis protein MshM
MYLKHFGLNEPPFRITPHTDFFFGGANRGATLDALLYAISHDEGIVKVTGEVGSGKTMLCRVLMERLPENVETIYLANPSLARDEILIAIADELDLDVGGERISRVVRALLERLIALYAEGRRVVVLVDEAHGMARDALEEIRLLSNLESSRHKLLQIVMFGQPELDAHLGTPDMRQLKERITHGFRLEPLKRTDIESYIEYRLRAAGYRGPNPFSSTAIRLITEASEGLTRRVNILADKAMLAAFAANTHAVSEREVRRAVDDSEFYRPPRRFGKLGFAGAGVAMGLAGGLGLAWLLFPGEPSPHGLSASTSVTFPASRDPPEAAPADPRPALQAAPTLTSARADASAPSTYSPPGKPTGPAPGSSSAHAVPPTRPTSPADTAPRAEPASATGNAPLATQTPLAGPLPPVRGKLAQERFSATQQWLQRAPDNHYAIQLMTVKSSDSAQLDYFLRRAAKWVREDDLRVYSVKIDGVQCYRAALGEYSNISDTLAAMNSLPQFLKAQNPYQRSVARMRSQNRQ